jgi:small-conductance mechanosensitive channel
MQDFWQWITRPGDYEWPPGSGIPLSEYTQWGFFLLLVLLLYIVLRIVLRIVRSKVKQFAERTEHPYDDYLLRLLENTRSFGILGLSVFLALYLVHLGGPFAAETIFRSIALVLLFVQAGVWANNMLDVVLERGFRFALQDESARKTAAGVVRWFALVVVWACVFLLILSALHIEITPLLAGLGVGGIAIGFALQQILGDIFCSVALVLDRPFEVGDFIITGEHMGTVEQIGIKTTRVRSLTGEQIIIPNSDLLGSRVRNYKRMQERRIVFGFGVTYATPADKLERIPGIVREIVASVEKTRFDRAHFLKFGDSALEFEVVYYVLSPDYNLYMDIQQKINLALVRRLQELNVEMAFPSRTVYLDRETTEAIRALAFKNLARPSADS